MIALQKHIKSKAMGKSFLEYYKVVLSKVSFDRKLFMKEYAKALSAIDHDEFDQFHEWLKRHNLRVN